jgi:exosortase A
VSHATRRLLEVCFIIAAVTALYWPTAVSYSVAWTDFDNLGSTHGYLIVLMCFALLYRRRHELASPVPRVSLAAYLALAALSLAWLLAYRASIQTAHQLLFPLILWSAIYAVFGRQVGRSCLFPVGFLYFALPVWGVINGPLQAMTIAATQVILRLIGLPVYFYGNLVHIPEGTFAIEGGCSGLHFAVVGSAIAAYYGELHRDSPRNRVLLIALAVALALLTNWIRVSIIITAGHLTNMQSYLVQVSHYGFGWALFAVAMAVFFFVASRIPVHSNGPAPAAVGESQDVKSRPAALAIMPALIAVTLGPALSWAAGHADVATVIGHPSPTSVPGWSGPLPALTGWKPVFIGADRELLATYRRGAAEVEWYKADYASQRQGKKLLGYYNSVLGSDEFRVLDQDVVIRGHHRFVNLQLENARREQSLLWYFYEIGTRELTSGLRAQLWYGVSSLAGPVDSGIVAFRAKCEPDCAAAGEQLRLFVDSICDDASRFGDCRRDP